MRKYLLLFVVLFVCFLFNGCLEFMLTANKVSIPNSVEGVWKNQNDVLYEIRKKDNYWANLTFLEKDKKDTTWGITLHKVKGSLFVCLHMWDKGKKGSLVAPLEIVSDKQFKLYGFSLSEQDQKDFKETPSNLKETVFNSFLQNDKLKINKKDISEESTKIYNLTD